MVGTSFRNEKHTSYEIAPNKPFWKVTKGKCDRISCTMSPSKSVNPKGQLMHHIQLHQLLERGGFSQQQYDDMQCAIMGEVKSL